LEAGALFESRSQLKQKLLAAVPLNLIALQLQGVHGVVGKDLLAILVADMVRLHTQHWSCNSATAASPDGQAMVHGFEASSLFWVYQPHQVELSLARACVLRSPNNHTYRRNHSNGV
jgi:hypothetical protein